MSTNEEEAVNELVEYINDLISLLNEPEEEQDRLSISALLDSGKNKQASYADVAEAVMYVTDSMLQYNDYFQALMEARMYAIIEALPQESKKEVKAKFKEAEDDMVELQEKLREEENEDE